MKKIEFHALSIFGGDFCPEACCTPITTTLQNNQMSKLTPCQRQSPYQHQRQQYQYRQAQPKVKRCFAARQVGLRQAYTGNAGIASMVELLSFTPLRLSFTMFNTVEVRKNNFFSYIFIFTLTCNHKFVHIVIVPENCKILKSSHFPNVNTVTGHVTCHCQSKHDT